MGGFGDMNKPVAWKSKSWQEAYNQGWNDCREQFIHSVKEQSNLVKVVQDHVKDLKRCVKVFRTQLLNNTANEMEVAIKELEDALESHPVKVNYEFNSSQLKQLTDEDLETLMRVALVLLKRFNSLTEEAILRKAQEK